MLARGRKMGFCGARSGRAVRSWLVEPLRDSNLQLFALVAVWIASKIHEMRPLAVKSLKALSDRIIADQHFTCRDFADAELVFMEVQLQRYWITTLDAQKLLSYTWKSSSFSSGSLNRLNHLLIADQCSNFNSTSIRSCVIN
ncbi:cyclin-J18-like isoform X1 [Lolium rigidum]|uniref:cyclin-J18-like isoform X1 n=1 Tax=Lolium rigidum TaxID=89674 RepID=UPI001F5C58D5|nr:cyclin-J18-like isoform X1 [Lolium rigidum]